ncbi:MAG: hypothetical protein ABSD38_20950 [Syntrophorhabdales bacterium]
MSMEAKTPADLDDIGGFYLLKCGAFIEKEVADEYWQDFMDDKIDLLFKIFVSSYLQSKKDVASLCELMAMVVRYRWQEFTPEQQVKIQAVFREEQMDEATL